MRSVRSQRASDFVRPLSRRRILSSVFVLALFMVPVFLPGSASADAVSDKRAEAQQIAAKLDQLDQKLSLLDEKFNDATIGLDKANQDVAAAQKRVDETNAQLDASAKQLQKFAVQAYMTGNDTQALDAILTSDAADATQKRSYLEAASGNKRDLMDKLSADKQKADEEIAQLNKAQDEAQSQSDAIKQARDDANAAQDEQQRLNDQAQGELATLVQQARAAEQAAQAAAAAKKIAAATAAAPAAKRVATTGTPTQPKSPTGPVVTAPVAPVDPGNGSGTPGAAKAIAAAMSKIGSPYVWAAAGPNSFDCSGLVMWAWAQAGRSLPHSSAAMWSSTRHVSLSALQPGDLIFYGSPVHHVALYIGGGTIVHAPNAGSSVRTNSINYWSDIAGAGRL
jgi:cell wall-associated NlpC family hydrolase